MPKNKRIKIAYFSAIGAGLLYLIFTFNFGFRAQSTEYCHGDYRLPDQFSIAHSLKPGECIPAIKQTYGWPITSHVRWYTPNGDLITNDRRPNAGIQVLNLVPLIAIGLATGYGVNALLKPRRSIHK